jgi:hypothetical protein
MLNPKTLNPTIHSKEGRTLSHIFKMLNPKNPKPYTLHSLNYKHPSSKEVDAFGFKQNR